MIKIDTRKDLDLELRKNKQVLALFHATWCPYCVRSIPNFDKKATQLGFKNIIHVILDDYDNQLWDDFNIPAVPTIIYFEDGKISKRLDGKLGSGLRESEFNVWIEDFKCV
jgi:thioredoxin 1